jgi:hypothetical protein
MESTMTNAKVRKAIDAHNAQTTLESLEGENNRARSVTVGNAFGGVTEVGMRSRTGTYVWCILMPTEVTELIHQLAANIGCHINIQPRNDFGSWRQWKEEGSPLLASSGWAPWPNHPPHAKIDHDNQPGLDMPVRSKENVVATEKTVNRRSAKRAAKAS